jgi:hypothetical protein
MFNVKRIFRRISGGRVSNGASSWGLLELTGGSTQVLSVDGTTIGSVTVVEGAGAGGAAGLRDLESHAGCWNLENMRRIFAILLCMRVVD